MKSQPVLRKFTQGIIIKCMFSKFRFPRTKLGPNWPERQRLKILLYGFTENKC